MDKKKEVEDIVGNSIIFTNTPLEMEITFPVKFIRERLSKKEVDDFFEDLIPIINQHFQEKLKLHSNQISEYVSIS